MDRNLVDSYDYDMWREALRYVDLDEEPEHQLTVEECIVLTEETA